jgi:hypothetical protein
MEMQYQYGHAIGLLELYVYKQDASSFLVKTVSKEFHLTPIIWILYHRFHTMARRAGNRLYIDLPSGTVSAAVLQLNVVVLSTKSPQLF